MGPSKVLILTIEKTRQFAGSRHEAGLQARCRRLQAINKDLQFFIASIDELLIRIENNEVTIHDGRNDRDLRDYRLVHASNVSFERDHFQAVGFYLQHYGVPFINVDDVRGTPFGKISQMVLFALKGVPVPDTLAVWNHEAHRKLVQELYSPPFIFKSNQGAKGNDNFLIERREQFDQLLMDKGMDGYIVQPFIPNDGDYRILYIGNERLIIYRESQGNSHLNNTSQGGDGRLLQPADCPEAVVAVANKAKEAYARKIGGVDVLVDKHTNAPYVLEINNTPAILSGVFLEEKSVKYAAFITDQLQGIEGKNI